MKKFISIRTGYANGAISIIVDTAWGWFLLIHFDTRKGKENGGGTYTNFDL